MPLLLFSSRSKRLLALLDVVPDVDVDLEDWKVMLFCMDMGWMPSR
jgi:hypothetical protein